jgi:ribosomal protein S18 acetylase RimI-like enzyme
MTIRPATVLDVPAVLPMVDRLAALHQRWDPARYDYKPDTGEMYRQWLAKRAADHSGSVFLVADHERLMADVPFIVGFLIGTVEQNLRIYRTERYGFVHDVWVEPDYRNEGIGRQMAMLAVERFRGLGVTQIRLETAAANEAARKLFASVGFRAATTEMLMEIGGRD